VAAGRPGDDDGREVRRLQQDRRRHRADLGRAAAHHAGERDRTAAVGDEQVLGVERAVLAVQGGQPLPRLRPADHDLALQRVEVEGVQRLPQLEHHRVGDVDGE